MSKYKILASHTITSQHSAEVEVEADSRPHAIREAKTLDEQGRLPWREDSSFQEEETDYSIISATDLEGVSRLQGDLGNLLEAYAIPEKTVTQIMALIAQSELENETITIALNLPQARLVRDNTRGAVKYTGDGTQQDFLRAIVKSIESTMPKSGKWDEQTVFEFTRNEANTIKGLLYEDMERWLRIGGYQGNINRAELAKTTIDQFEQCLGDR